MKQIDPRIFAIINDPDYKRGYADGYYQEKRQTADYYCTMTPTTTVKYDEGRWDGEADRIIERLDTIQSPFS